MRGRALAVWSLSALSYVGFASVASAASRPHERSGFWIGLGGGVGSAGATCDDCEGGDRETGATGHLKLGGTLSDRVLIGGEFNIWWKERDGVTLNLYNAIGTLTFYPRPSSGFFLKGGVGLAFLDTEVREGSTAVTIDLGTGLGLLAGAGYDIRLWRNISITPAVNYWYGWAGDLTLEGGSLTNWKHNVVDFTVGITFH